MRFKFIWLFVFTLALAGAVTAQQADIAALSATEGGKRVLAYFDAFNSGDEAKLSKFFSENISAESLKQRPVEPRLAFHRQVRSDFGKLEIVSIKSVKDDEIGLIARGSTGGSVAYTFEFSADKKIQGLSVSPADGPGSGGIPLSAVAAPASVEDLPAAVEKLYETQAKADQFSGVILLAKNGTPILTKSYGFANAASKSPNHVDTKFNLGSINKMMTRVAIGQLVKQGKLSFNDKLIKVLPDYPNREIAEKITIGQIVTMRSGLGDFFNEKFMAAPNKIRDLKDYLPLFADVPLEFEPGTKNRYSNAGYLVLGLVIEKLSGESYYEYIRKNIFEPAGMKNSGWYEIDKLPANTAIGYMKKGSPNRVPNAPALPGKGSSAGGGYSTAGDLLKFAVALDSGKLQVPNEDGTFPSQFKGFGIAGGSEGVNGIFIARGQGGYTFIALSNYDPPSAEAPGMQVNDWLKQLKQ